MFRRLTRSGSGLAGAGGEHEAQFRRGRLRLAIAIPALMVLFVLAHGLLSLKILDLQWESLEELRAGFITRTMLRHHLYAMLALAVAAAVCGGVIVFAIVRPIYALLRTAERITGGALGERAPSLPLVPELGDLSRSFNSMIEFLNDSIAERDRYLIEGIVSGIMTVDMKGRVTALNATGARVLNLESSAVVGRDVRELLDALPAMYHVFWEYVRGSISRVDPPMSDMLTFSTGRERLQLLIGTSELRGPKGEAQGMLFNFRPWAEIKSLRQHLSRTDQLAALGTFTMGLAHELRNPLASIKGIVQLLQSDPATAESARACLGMIVNDVNRMDRFVSELSEYSNQAPEASAAADIGELLRAAAAGTRGVAEQHAEKGIRLVEDYEPLPPVRVQAARLTQAFENIIRNAYEAAAPGGVITLRARCRQEPEGRFIVAQLSNTGSTIEAGDRSRIFEPFFTTKAKGSGLGLAIVYQIITQQHGTITASVGPNEVTFIVRFRADGAEAITDEQEGPFFGGGE